MAETIWSWGRVPDKSRLEVSVSTDDDRVNVTGYLNVEPGAKEDWDHDDLVPGPRRVNLRTPRVYVATIVLNFLGEKPTTATVSGHVITPDDREFGSAYEESFTGKAESVTRVSLIVMTLKTV